MKRYLPALIAAVSAAAASALYYPSFTAWKPPLYFLSVLLFAVAAGIVAGRFAAKKKALKGLIAALAYTGAFFALSYLINNVILHATQAKLAACIMCGLNLLFFIAFYCVCSRKKEKKRWLAALAFAVPVVITLLTVRPLVFENHYKYIQAPKAGKEITEMKRDPIKDADFYVSPDGDDSNDGGIDKPFLTFDRAKQAVRDLDKSGRSSVTVAVKAGDYRVDTVEFTAEDSGTKDCPVIWAAYGDGEVVINGGVTLPHESFRPVEDEETAERLTEDARGKVLCVDLSKLGITKEQYGKIYAIGGYNTASRYDGDWVGGIYCELFIDDARQAIARYPNGKEYLYTGAVVSEGQGRESSSAALKNEYGEVMNPEPDVYKMSKSLSDRIASWKTLDDVWMFGYWRYDWADGSTPLGSVDHEKLTMSPMFVSTYGAKKGAPYYFFNVFEELDAPGEWYLDRDDGMLYFYPPEGFSDGSSVELTLSEKEIIKANADYLTFDGFTVKGTRADAVSITGDGNVVKNCLIKNVAGNAITVDGYDNLVTGNEITRTGKGGVILSGGDTETLEKGNNRAENNLVHDWSEIYETYQPAFTLNGVGNVCSHNEMYDSPHEAVTYSGNDHLIEYNLIHDVNLLTDDGGAIYSGRRWDWYGTVIRYNLIYDLGKDGHRPVGIYMDDALAGQTIYGNIIINAPNIGLQLGGGRDLDVHDNIVINSTTPISYDDRGLSGLSGDENSSFYQHYKKNGSVWQLLYESPWQSETWRKAYPQYDTYSDDFSNTDDPDFVLNPGHSSVTHNLLISYEGKIGDIADTVYKYSSVQDNAVFKLSKLRKIFVDPENGDYTLRSDAPIGFEIDVPPMDSFGRQPK